jgi:uncharacterized protein (DUF697 family)
MGGHLAALAVFALLVSLVFGTLHRGQMRARVLFALKVFGGFVASAALVGWLMSPFPR